MVHFMGNNLVNLNMSPDKNPTGIEAETTIKVLPVIRTTEDFEALAKRFDIAEAVPKDPTAGNLGKIEKNPFASEPYSQLKGKLRQLRQELLQHSSSTDKAQLGESINQIIEEMEQRSPQEITESRAQEEEDVRKNAQKIPSDMWNVQLNSYRQAQDIFSANPYNSPVENQAIRDEFAWKIAVSEEEFMKRREINKTQPEETGKVSQSGFKGFMGRVFGNK